MTIFVKRQKCQLPVCCIVTLKQSMGRSNRLNLTLYKIKLSRKKKTSELQIRGLKHAARMWPARAFCAARDAFQEFSYNQNLSYLVYSPVFIGSRPASEQVPF